MNSRANNESQPNALMMVKGLPNTMDGKDKTFREAIHLIFSFHHHLTLYCGVAKLLSYNAKPMFCGCDQLRRDDLTTIISRLHSSQEWMTNKHSVDGNNTE